MGSKRRKRQGSVFVPRLGLFAILIVPVALSACSPTFRHHGFIPPVEELEQIVVGVDTRGTVESLVGAPSSTGIERQEGWYYISTRIKHFAYREPEVIERQMLAISFDEEEVVANIERFDLTDGEVIPLNRRITETPVKGPGFWSQILGNITNLDAGSLLNRN